MNDFKLIEEMQEQFMKNPRESIEKKIKNEKNSILYLKKFNMNLKQNLIFLNYHKEYATLVGKLLESKILNINNISDNVSSVSIVQRMSEWQKNVKEYKELSNEITSLNLAKAYASSCEILWKKLKRFVYLSGKHDVEKHFDVRILKQKICEFEQEYNIKLSKLKEMVDSKLRNFIGHENTLFIAPNQVSFFDSNNVDSKENLRLTTDEIYGKLVENNIILMAFISVDNTALVSQLEKFLNLSDDELKKSFKKNIPFSK